MLEKLMKVVSPEKKQITTISGVVDRIGQRFDYAESPPVLVVKLEDSPAIYYSEQLRVSKSAWMPRSVTITQPGDRVEFQLVIGDPAMFVAGTFRNLTLEAQ